MWKTSTERCDRSILMPTDFPASTKNSPELTLLIIKPDAQEHGLTSEIKRRLDVRGLRVVRETSLILDMPRLQALYGWEVVTHFEALNSYLCTRPLTVWLISGCNAVRSCLD